MIVIYLSYYCAIKSNSSLCYSRNLFHYPCRWNDCSFFILIEYIKVTGSCNLKLRRHYLSRDGAQCVLLPSDRQPHILLYIENICSVHKYMLQTLAFFRRAGAEILVRIQHVWDDYHISDSSQFPRVEPPHFIFVFHVK